MSRKYPQLKVDGNERGFLIAVLQIVLTQMELPMMTTKGMGVYDLALLVATKYYGKVTSTPEQPLFSTPAIALQHLAEVSENE